MNTLTNELADKIHGLPFVRDCLLAYHEDPQDDTARAVVFAIADQIAALQPTGDLEGGEVHPDDACVDRLAAAMKAKLADARAKDRGGWQEPGLQQHLSDLLREHVNKGDPRDVANFCAFLWSRGESIAAPSPHQPATAGAERPVWQLGLTAEQIARVEELHAKLQASPMDSESFLTEPADSEKEQS